MAQLPTAWLPGRTSYKLVLLLEAGCTAAQLLAHMARTSKGCQTRLMIGHAKVTLHHGCKVKHSLDGKSLKATCLAKPKTAFIFCLGTQAGKKHDHSSIGAMPKLSTHRQKVVGNSQPISETSPDLLKGKPRKPVSVLKKYLFL